MKILVREAALFLAMSIGIAGATTVTYVGAALLRNVRDDVESLLGSLPTRANEDSVEAREANRVKAWKELVWLVGIRSAPGALLAFFGFILLCVLSMKVLDIAASAMR